MNVGRQESDGLDAKAEGHDEFTSGAEPVEVGWADAEKLADRAFAQNDRLIS